MSIHLEPHSDGWFQRMRQINPMQAEMTANVVRLSGTPQCCSICGDTDAIADYKMVSDPTLTVRLCDDCKRLQKEQYGLSLDPV